MIDIGTKKIPCIDAHAHVLPTVNGLRLKNKRTYSGQCGMIHVVDRDNNYEDYQFFGPEFISTSSPIEVFRRHMELNGIDKAVFPQNFAYGYTYDYLDNVLRSDYGKFQTLGFAYPCDGEERFMAEAREALDKRGYIGLKFEMPDTPFQTDAPENQFVFKTLLERNKYCMIDMGWHDGEWDYPIDMITNTVKQYKDLTFIFPHLGVSYLWKEEEHEHYEHLKKTLDLLNYNDNVWFDISGINFMAADFDDYPHYKCQNVLKLVKDTIGLNHVMWGTDYPCITLKSSYRFGLKWVKDHCDFLTESDKEHLFYKNADQLWFGIKHD